MKTSTKYLNLEYAPGPVTVTSTTAWLKYHFEQEVDGDVSPRPVLDQYNVERYRQFSRSEEHTSELQSLMRISYAASSLTQQTIHFFPSSGPRQNTCTST